MESSRGKLQEYAIVYRVSHLKSWRWPSGDSSRSNQWYLLMAPSKPYNFCLKHFFLKCIVYEIFDRFHTFETPCIYKYMYTYTGCFVLNDTVDYLANRWFYWKIFQTKIAWFEGGHMMKIWTWSWVTFSKSGQGH